MFPLPLVSLLALVATGALGAFLLWRLRGHHRAAHDTLTPERQVIYEMAVEYLRNPTSLRSLAGEYDRQGLPTIATRLRKRAEVQELPAEQKLARREAYRRALKSTNTDAILALAQAYDDSGSPGAAYNLRRRVEGINAALKAGRQPPNPVEDDSFLSNNAFAGDPRRGEPSNGGRKRKRGGRGASVDGGRPMPPSGRGRPSPRVEVSRREEPHESELEDIDESPTAPSAEGKPSPAGSPKPAPPVAQVASEGPTT